MARIELVEVSHSYLPDPSSEADYALQSLSLAWKNEGAYALLGPSGCGKTTLLNIISGLLRPSRGRVLYDGVDVTDLDPRRRNIAQVFQFPVIYDTMSVYDNLAFPLRNRGMKGKALDGRVRQVAEILDLTDRLKERARGLGAEQKQIISLGRGLVREDTAAILFDEPLTVIEPRQKNHLRRKLKELHRRIRIPMIYVTHDQTEAMTFADEVIVMRDGGVLQVGEPRELFERPAHTFVGHFIGSPGMNFLEARPGTGAGELLIGDIAFNHPILAGKTPPETDAGDKLILGIRPEFFQPATQADPGALPVLVDEIAHLGAYKLLTGRIGNQSVKIKLDTNYTLAGQGAGTSSAASESTTSDKKTSAWFIPEAEFTHLYANERLVTL